MSPYCFCGVVQESKQYKRNIVCKTRMSYTLYPLCSVKVHACYTGGAVISHIPPLNQVYYRQRLTLSRMCVNRREHLIKRKIPSATCVLYQSQGLPITAALKEQHGKNNTSFLLLPVKFTNYLVMSDLFNLVQMWKK